MFTSADVAGLITLTGEAADAVWSSMARPPRLELSAVTASTLDIDIDDPDHDVTPLLAGLTADLPTMGTTWHLAGVRRRTRGVTRLTFEDSVVTRLRRTITHLSVPAGSTTLDELVTRLATFADVDCTLEPVRRTLTAAVRVDGSVWRAVTALAETHGLWRYSTGTHLVAASPTWHLHQVPADQLDDDSEEIGDITFTVDTGRTHDTAAADTTDWIPTIGAVTALDGLGAASGPWVVATWTTHLGADTGRVTWTRPTGDQPWA